MIRVLFFLVVVFALGLGFAWLADRPGELLVTFGGYQYRVTLMVAAAIITAIVAAVMILWWLIKGIWNSPHAVRRYFRARRRDRGYQALSTGMIAAGAGDSGLARKMNRQASKLLNANQEPLIHLLDAQASLLEGDHDAARQKFQAMLDDPEMRLLGLRGLYLEAERLGERDAARHYAEQAAAAAPQLAWASTAALEARTAEGDWDGAIRLLDSQKSSHQIERDVANRRRAVLLTAKAMTLIDTDPLTAKNAAVEANRLAPDLVPAAVVAAKALVAQNDLRRAAKILEAAWKIEPHPDLAQAYVAARAGDSTHDRLKRARKLQSLKRNHPESALAVARAAVHAGEYAQAREAAEAAIRMEPRESAYLLLADIEEAETGDVGKVRQLLAKAVRAGRDPAWTADGYVSERWAPISPVTGRLDAFEWRVPVERLGQLIEPDAVEEEPAPTTLPAALPPLPQPVEETAPQPETIEEAILLPDEKAEAVIVPEQKPAQPIIAPPPVRPTAPPANDDRHSGHISPEPHVAEAFPPEPERAARRDEPRLIQTPQPDDPGVDTDDENPETESRRFRLF
jgi:HemY protein